MNTFRPLSHAIMSIAMILPARGFAQMGNPALTRAPATNSEIARTYSMMTNRDRQSALDELNFVCASKRQRDVKRCDAAWRKINAAHARLQARRAQNPAK